MARRPRHPLKSFVLFVLAVAVGWTAWSRRDDLRFQRKEHKPDAAMLVRMDEAIGQRFGSDPCFLGMQGGVGWRTNEGRFKVDIDVDAACGASGRDLCEQIARLIESIGKRPASVFAYNGAGALVTQFVL